MRVCNCLMQGGFSNADGLTSSTVGSPHTVGAKSGSMAGNGAQSAGSNLAAEPPQTPASPQAMADIEQAAPAADALQRVQSWDVPPPQADAMAAQANGQQQQQRQQQHQEQQRQRQHQEQQQQQQQSAALVTGLDVCSDPDAAPAGVAGRIQGGECLLHHRARVISVPELQVLLIAVLLTLEVGHPALHPVAS